MQLKCPRASMRSAARLSARSATAGFGLMCVAAGAALLPVHAYAAEYSANRLLPGCELLVSPPTALTNAQALAAGECLGMITGMLQTLPIMEQLKLLGAPIVCVPEGATQGQLAQVVVKYIESHPADMHRSFVGQAFSAFFEAWPCGEPSTKK
jgi:hypothetical protein